MGILLPVLVEVLGELLAPTRCCACEELVLPRVLFCPACAISVTRAARVGAAGEDALFAYGGSVATAVMRMKYAARWDLAARLGAALGEHARLPGHVAHVDVVVPVPLHPARLVSRGFDQGALLARPVAKALGRPCGVGTLRRTRDTPKQATLDRAARLANVTGAFVCNDERSVRGKHVLLVDDVATTGATLLGCRAVVSAAGAASVRLLVLARRELDP